MGCSMIRSLHSFGYILLVSSIVGHPLQTPSSVELGVYQHQDRLENVSEMTDTQ